MSPDGVVSSQHYQWDFLGHDRAAHASPVDDDDRASDGTKGGALHALHLNPPQAND